ncbi:MAG TPA: HAMP domain-containing methyl-accepting chemotaxis protein [Magnetospirillum sp.]|nr:HAMP domain-containing methyl-accepting chemotaxis protein [Magnetospirillum sp.]
MIANGVLGVLASGETKTMLARYAESSQKAERSTGLKTTMNALVNELRLGMVDTSGQARQRASTGADDMRRHIAQLATDASADSSADSAEAQFAADLGTLQQTFSEYLVNFNKVLEIGSRRDKSAETMYRFAPEVFDRTAELNAHAYETGSRNILDRTKKLEDTLLKAQIEIFRFMRQPQKQTSEAIDAYLRDALSLAKQLTAAATDDKGREISRNIETSVNNFKRAFFEVSSTTFVGQRLFGEVMEQQSKSILALCDALTRNQTEQSQASVAAAEAASKRRQTTILVMNTGFLAIGIVLAALIARNVAGGIRRMTGAMTRLAQGEEATEIPGLGKRDEIGDMARALQVFKENAHHMRELEANRLIEAAQAEEQRKQTLLGLANDFEAKVKGIVDTVSTSSRTMERSAEELLQVASQTNQQAGIVASSSEEASANVEAVATAAEELAASISEISRQVEQSSTIASDAVTEVEQVSETMERLSQASQRIGAVVHLINLVAHQTNLLALNATIEAARAGEAGKGFAVVAGEVKALANQTAQATEEISQQVVEVQAVTGHAVQAINGVAATIGRINDIAAAIAAAVAQQGAATAEISANIHRAATGTQEVSTNIGGVSAASDTTGRASERVLKEATNLSNDADNLRESVATFISHLRAG